MIPPTDAVLNHISQEFDFGEIREATQSFSSSHRLGEGTYGTVFRGTLRDGTEVAVKALASPKEGGFREEVEVLSRFRHPNLVILMGFARHGRERYLIYELLPGGDVNSRLNKDPSFTWKNRLNVVLDCALGLSHLHGSRPQVFHRDVKTQNMLMDKNGTGKVADFGLACLAQPNQHSLAVKETSGTLGYADPLYIRSGVVTEKSEVYSLGMVLLEVLTGRPPALQHPNGRIEYQFDHIGGDAAKLMAMVDRRGQWPPAMAQHVGHLALSCTCEQEQIRPSFVDIVTKLRKLLRDESLHQTAPAEERRPSMGYAVAPAQAAGPWPQNNPFADSAARRGEQQAPLRQQQQQQMQHQQQIQQQQQLQQQQQREQMQRQQQQQQAEQMQQQMQLQRQREQMQIEARQREQMQQQHQQREQLKQQQQQWELRQQQKQQQEQLKKEQQLREHQQQQEQMREQQRLQMQRQQQHQREMMRQELDNTLRDQQQQREMSHREQMQREQTRESPAMPFPQQRREQRGVPAERAGGQGRSSDTYMQREQQQPRQLQQPARPGHGGQSTGWQAQVAAGGAGRASGGSRVSEGPGWPQPRAQAADVPWQEVETGGQANSAPVSSGGSVSGGISSQSLLAAQDREDDTKMLLEMGYDRAKILEAWKRCSTLEAAVEWMSEH